MVSATNHDPSRSCSSESPWEPRSQVWDAAAELDGLTRDDLNLKGEDLTELEQFLWFDLCAEFDSCHLHNALRDLSLDLSEEFFRFERLWFRDERNHENGFRRLYQLIFDEDDSAIDERLSLRKPNFSPFKEFMADELTLLVLFAYDELATCHGYKEDFPRYRRLNNQVLPSWLKKIIRDEAFHYRNARDLAIRRFPHRMDEVPGIIDTCVSYDQRSEPYLNTFLFDHCWEGVTPEFFQANGQRLLRQFQGGFSGLS